ncbi:Tfp pilus assembly protein PilX [Candidatus Moduliflexus flocculans]|uniref:Tfp pilus assembly protein PilX n=1 Tax=Candidatus Moduliflexus flocculans TaxID=1499966 RepID=A0A0S6W474_9BACT|nr:Tfp pilus assembly protein PilX [Candidatus Moduliflexus flocculans]
MKLIGRDHSRGVALLAALFVLMVMSILAIGMLANVDEDLKISKNYENSERALKIAENGIQIAREKFFDGGSYANLTDTTKPVTSVNGFINGGYFLTYLTSGFAGNETWEQWRYNFNLSGNNTESEITAPLFTVWATAKPGTNGRWDGSVYYLTNLNGIVATGVFFPIENTANGDTNLRTHHEYTGTYLSDRSLVGGGQTLLGVKMSPTATYTRYKDRQTLREQVMYFTYNGHPTAITSTSADTSSTVRLRAVNLLDTDTTKLKLLWEFDTGLHGFGTAPTLFDPTPPDPSDTDKRHRGDEVIYFAVISQGRPMTSSGTTGTATQTPTAGWNYAYSYPSGLTRTFNINGAYYSASVYPEKYGDYPEQIYLFAVVDTGAGYKLKWARPFPDPDVAEWTDYPIEHATGTTGQRFPFVGRPSDIAPYPLEDDLLTDYRDGPGRNYLGSANRHYDQQWNQVRGNMGFSEPLACSPPVLNILYRDSTGALTENYQDATAASKMNPTINLYLMFSFYSRVTYVDGGGIPLFGGDTASGGFVKSVNSKDGWGGPGYRKPDALQTRVVALRDRLVAANATPADDIATGAWKWNHPRSRYPELKWVYRVPGWDPNETDAIPATGYGEYSWDTWFDQHIAPMVMTQTTDSDDGDGDGLRGEQNVTSTGVTIDRGTSFSAIRTTAGKQDRYPVVYANYRSTGFPTGGGGGTDTPTNYNALAAPTLAQGGVAGFAAGWDDTRAMVMAMRDTWDDYRAGDRTNIVGASNANPDLSNPVEPYWYYSQYDGANGPNADNYKYQDRNLMVVYNSTLKAPFQKGVQVGFPRPYSFAESTWKANVRDLTDTTKEWSLKKQGWADVTDFDASASSKDYPFDLDIEGETMAMCSECINGDGLLVFPFNLDLTGASGTQREDLRLHGINARTGLHLWDYHTAASWLGDNANNTPGIANDKVFLAYMKYGAETIAANRIAKIIVLDAADGSELAPAKAVDADADAVLLPPTIANGMAYIATYKHGGSETSTEKYIRLFAMSPIIRLVSTAVYPAPYKTSAALQNYSTLLLDRDDDYVRQRIRSSRRKIQVWITGNTSRWEEIKENIE